MKYWQNKSGTLAINLNHVLGFRCIIDSEDNSLLAIELILEYRNISVYRREEIGELHNILKKKFTA